MIELTILIPCLNEENTVVGCVRQATTFLHSHGIEGEVLVADNGSLDKTVLLAKGAGARVITCRKKGYGNILRYGIREAAGMYVLMADGDMSYHFAEAGPLVEALRGGADLVVGNRFALPMEKGAMPPLHRFFGVPFLSVVGRFRYRTGVKDFHCGMRAVNRASFLKLGCRCSGMEFATEMIGRAAIAGQTIAQVPVKLYKDRRGRRAHVRSFRDGFRHLFFMLGIPLG